MARRGTHRAIIYYRRCRLLTIGRPVSYLVSRRNGVSPESRIFYGLLARRTFHLAMLSRRHPAALLNNNSRLRAHSHAHTRIRGQTCRQSTSLSNAREFHAGNHVLRVRRILESHSRSRSFTLADGVTACPGGREPFFMAIIARRKFGILGPCVSSYNTILVLYLATVQTLPHVRGPLADYSCRSGTI